MKQFENIQQSIFITFILAISGMLVIPAHAAEFHVTTTQELQTALSTAAENNQSDSIFLAAGIYKGNFRFNTEESDTSLSIQAEEGLNAGNVVLDGEERDRVLLIDSGDNELNINIVNLTVRNGKVSGGAGISIKTKGEIDIINCNIHDNYSTSNGGGLYILYASKLFITKTIVKNNQAYGRGVSGSGLFTASIEEVTLIENDFSYNTFGYKDSYSVINIGSTKDVLIKKNNITMNKGDYGAGLSISASNQISVLDNTISKNESISHSAYNRGVISINAPEIEFKNNEILSNIGAVNISANNLLNIDSNYLSNTLGSTTGVLHISSKLITAKNNIITNNDWHPSYLVKSS